MVASPNETPVPAPISRIPSNERRGTNSDIIGTPKLNKTATIVSHKQTAEEEEIVKSFLQGSMSIDVEDKLKNSAKLRQSVLGKPISLKAQEAVVKGRMSPDLRSLLINDLNTLQQSKATEVKPAAPGAAERTSSALRSSVINPTSATATAVPAPAMGNMNSTELRAIDTVKKYHEAIKAGHTHAEAVKMANEKVPDEEQTEPQPQPPKRVMTAKRSNRPERPVPSTPMANGTGTRTSDKVRPSGSTKSSHATNSMHTMGQKPIRPDPIRLDPTSPEIPRVVSDIPVPSYQDLMSGMGMQDSNEVNNRNLENATGLKRKRDSLHPSPSEPTTRQKTSHSELVNKQTEPSPALSPAIRDSTRARSSTRQITEKDSTTVHDKSTQGDTPANPVDADNVSMDDADGLALPGFTESPWNEDNDTAGDEDLVDNWAESGDSDEDISMAGDDETVNDEDIDEENLDEENINEEIVSKPKSIPKDEDWKSYDYHSFRGVRTAGAWIPPEYQNHDDPKYPWICPVRSCRVLFTSMTGMGGHWNRGHRTAQLNDNKDGTLSIVGYQDESGVRPAVVVSRRPLDPDEPPMVEPKLPLSAKYARVSHHISSKSPSTTEYTPTGRVTASHSAGPNPRPSGPPTSLGPLKSPRPAGASGLTAKEMALWKYIHPYLKNTPFSPVPHNGHVPELLHLPRVRDVEFNPEAQFPYSEAKSQDISALIIQVTGEKSDPPCSRCRQGKGPFKGCYVISSKAPLAERQVMTGCANCYYKSNNTYCSVKNRSKQRVSEQGVSAPSEFQLRKPLIQPPAQKEPKEKESKDKDPEGSLSDKFSVRRQSERIVLRETISKPSTSFTYPESSPAESRSATHLKPSETTRSRVGTRSNQQLSMQDDVVRFANPQENVADPAQQLELETWEIAPGRIRNEEKPPIENVAFSTTYLTQNQAVAVARDVAFQVIIIKPGTMYTWKDTTHKLRLCSVATGKVKVKMHDKEFTIGPNGMFKVGPGVECTAMNMLYIDTTLHVSVMPSTLLSA